MLKVLISKEIKWTTVALNHFWKQNCHQILPPIWQVGWSFKLTFMNFILVFNLFDDWESLNFTSPYIFLDILNMYFQVWSIKCHFNIRTCSSNLHKKSIRSLFQSKLSLKSEKCNKIFMYVCKTAWPIRLNYFWVKFCPNCVNFVL